MVFTMHSWCQSPLGKDKKNLAYLESGFLNSSTVDICGLIIVVEAILCISAQMASIRWMSLFPTPVLSSENQKCVKALPYSPWGQNCLQLRTTVRPLRQTGKDGRGKHM